VRVSHLLAVTHCLRARSLLLGCAKANRAV
jgi:hypothetical protein